MKWPSVCVFNSPIPYTHTHTHRRLSAARPHQPQLRMMASAGDFKNNAANRMDTAVRSVKSFFFLDPLLFLGMRLCFKRNKRIHFCLVGLSE